MLGGFPIYTDLVGGFFNPINFFIFKQHISSFLAYNIETLFYLLLLFASIYYLSRELKVSKKGSLISAASLFFAQWTLSWGVTLPMSSTFFILPLLFLAILKIKNGRYLWCLSIIAATWVGLIGGHYQTLFYILED